MKIPILNIYYLLCYAWDRLEEAELVDVRASDPKELNELLACVLDSGVRRLLRYGIDRGYVEHEETIAGVRGRIDFATSIKRATLRNARTHCVFDELSYDVLHNRIVKSTLGLLAGSQGLDQGLTHGLRFLRRELATVSDVELTAALFHRVQLHRNIRFYEFLLNVCRLVYESVLPEEEAGRWRFRDFTRDERKMAGVFQNFVQNFYTREQGRFRVRSRMIAWADLEASSDVRPYIPTMRTDVNLEASDRVIILDTKFYQHALVGHHGAKRIRSEHLYQLYSYLDNFRGTRPNAKLEGMLLYPVVDEAFDLRFRIGQYPVRVVTLQLNQSWPTIHDDLLALLN